MIQASLQSLIQWQLQQLSVQSKVMDNVTEQGFYHDDIYKTDLRYVLVLVVLIDILTFP